MELGEEVLYYQENSNPQLENFPLLNLGAWIANKIHQNLMFILCIVKYTAQYRPVQDRGGLAGGQQLRTYLLSSPQLHHTSLHQGTKDI